MNGKRSLVVIACSLLAITACTALQSGHGSGTIAMVPFASDEHGIRGVTPPEGWADRAALVQQSFPGTKDELVAIIAEQTDLIALPRSIGTYKGSALTWDLYTFETQLKDVEPGIYRVDMGLAEGESAIHLVFLITVPAEYATHPALYETVFAHALYALTPIE
jgi:hypothetical protein